MDKRAKLITAGVAATVVLVAVAVIAIVYAVRSDGSHYDDVIAEVPEATPEPSPSPVPEPTPEPYEPEPSKEHCTWPRSNLTGLPIYEE